MGPDGDGALEIQCHLDSGAEVSLFDGEIAHGIRHEELGEHELRVGFSEQRQARNLLGRDFFNLFRIGFRERQSILLFEPEE